MQVNAIVVRPGADLLQDSAGWGALETLIVLWEKSLTECTSPYWAPAMSLGGCRPKSQFPDVVWWNSQWVLHLPYPGWQQKRCPLGGSMSSFKP